MKVENSNYVLRYISKWGGKHYFNQNNTYIEVWLINDLNNPKLIDVIDKT